MATDMDLLVMLLDAVGALAKKLTGETLVVRLTELDGGITWFKADGSHTKWVKQTEAAQVPLLDREVFAAIPPTRSDTLHDTL